MVAPFPLAKLLTLVMRQTAKPVAKGIKSLARKSAVFRKYVCVLPAQSKWCMICLRLKYFIEMCATLRIAKSNADMYY